MGWKLPPASSPFAPEFSLSKRHIAQLLNEDASTLKGPSKTHRRDCDPIDDDGCICCNNHLHIYKIMEQPPQQHNILNIT